MERVLPQRAYTLLAGHRRGFDLAAFAVVSTASATHPSSPDRVRSLPDLWLRPPRHARALSRMRHDSGSPHLPLSPSPSHRDPIPLSSTEGAGEHAILHARCIES